MNDVIKYIQQGIINCNYLDMYYPCHTCHIYGIWRSKEVRDPLKSSFGMTMQASTGGGEVILMRKWGFPLCNTAVLKFYYKSYWVL